jgi:AP-4 complex subunit epsilon-1
VVCAALTTVCRLVNEETIPAVLPQVADLLVHPKVGSTAPYFTSPS